MAGTMHRRPSLGRKGTVMVLLPTLAVVIAKTKGSAIFETPREDLEDEDYLEYIQEVSVASAGLGVGLSVAFGLVAFVSMLFMCCRCKRLHRADLAIAQAEGDNDGKGLDDMYEIEDYEDKISKHRKILWLFSLILFLGYLFCAGYAYNGAKTTYASSDSIFEGTDVFMTKLQQALCSENGSPNCSEGSIGMFMLDIAEALVDRLELVVAFISNLAVVTLPLASVGTSLQTATGVINTTEAAVVNINGSITSVNLILTGDGKVAEVTDGGAIATIPESTSADIQEGRDALAEASRLTGDSAIEVSDQLTGNESAIVRIKYQLDDIHGNEILGDPDLRNETLKVVIDEVLLPTRELTQDIYDFQSNELPEAQEGAETYLNLVVTAVAAIIFLPGLILFLTSLCSGICQSSKILFCLVAGIFLAIAKINGDICDHHLSFFEANLDSYNSTVQGVEIVLDYGKLEKVLTCDGEFGDAPTSSNNFVDILGIQQVFNISSELEEASTLITDNSALLSEPKSTILDARNQLGPLTDFVEIDFMGDVNIDDSAEEVDELLADAPPEPFDWDNRQHQDAMDSFYLKNVTEYSWNNESTGVVTYRGQLEVVNDLIELMKPDIIGQGAFADIEVEYNFTLARSLTNETVCAEDSPFQPDTANNAPRKSASTGQLIYTYDTQYDDLCDITKAYFETTKKLEILVEENGETRLELEEVRYELGLIGTNATVITNQQLVMGELRDDMNDTLGELADTLDVLVIELNNLADNLASLNDIVMGASNYTMCGYIGDFYQDVYLDAMCTDLQGNIEAVAGAALTVVILMFISFCVQGCYGPSMRKRPRGTAGDFDGGKDRLNGSGELMNNNLPTPHSPTPLVGNSGF